MLKEEISLTAFPISQHDKKNLHGLGHTFSVIKWKNIYLHLNHQGCDKGHIVGQMH